MTPEPLTSPVQVSRNSWVVRVVVTIVCVQPSVSESKGFSISSFVMHSRSVSVCGPLAASAFIDASISARWAGVILSSIDFGNGGMPLV